jgi:hypothetical protein
MKIALIADSHLSDTEITPQEESLNWALEELKIIAPDACVWLGDITACGSPDAAIRFRSKTDRLPFPSLTVPGNSELRTQATAEAMERYLLSHPKGLHIGDLSIIGVDTSRNKILPWERQRISSLPLQRRILLCSHQPAKYLDPDSLDFLTKWIRNCQRNGHQILLWASGHRHVYDTGTFEGIPTVSLRALDLDKCIGGSGQILVWDPDTLEMEEHVYSRGLPRNWTWEARKELADLTGITCYERTKLDRDMPFAIQNGVRHLEWKKLAENEIPLIDTWRHSGGRTFSLHMTALDYDNGVIGLPELREAAQNALRAGADMITVHPPQIAHAQMQLGMPAFEAVADAMAEAFLPLAAAGIEILVENNHTYPPLPTEPAEYPYGCTPLDLFQWRDSLKQRLGTENCHLRLDVGHARNNEPISESYPIAKWYSIVGPASRGYHLHQTIFNRTTRKMENHHPITEWNGDMISFDGFLWAWHTGILRHAPVILEIREGEGACATWQRLQRLLLEV